MKQVNIKKLSLVGLKLIIAGFFLYILNRQAQLDFDLITHIFSNLPLLISIVLLLYSLLLIGAWRWDQLNRAQMIFLPFKHTLLLTYYSCVFNNILPGNVGGDLVRLLHLIRRFPTQKSAIFLAAFFDRLIGLLGIVVMIMSIGLIKFSLVKQHYILFYIWVLCGLAFFGFIAVLFLAKWLHHFFLKIKWAKIIHSLLQALVIYQGSWMTVTRCIALSVVLQALMVVILITICKILTLPVLPFFTYAMALGVAQIVNLIPISPGGLGVGEMAFASMLYLLNPGILAPYATVYLTFRFLSLVSYLPGALLYLLSPSFDSPKFISSDSFASIALRKLLQFFKTT